MVEAGQICKKLAGRETGRYCVVVKVEGNFAEISGVAKYGMCKRKRCNLKHLLLTKYKIQLKSEKQDDVEKSISESGIITRLGLIKDRRRSKILFKQRKKTKPEKPKRIKKVKETKVSEKPKETKEAPKSKKTKPKKGTKSKK